MVPPRATYRGGHPVIYVTFDDGPSPVFTPEVLRVLAKHDAAATFFVIGNRAVKSPDLIRREVAAGDSVGDHSWSHPHLRTLTTAQVDAQLAQTTDLLRGLGAPARCFRPPFGESDARVRLVARRLHLHQYLWTAESKDWTHTPAAITLSKALAGLAPGGVVVFHDGFGSSSPATIETVDNFLTIAEMRGYIAAALPC